MANNGQEAETQIMEANNKQDKTTKGVWWTLMAKKHLLKIWWQISAKKIIKMNKNSRRVSGIALLLVAPKCIIVIAEFLDRAKSYAHLVIEGGILVDSKELKKIEKRIVLVFVVDKPTRKICRSTKDKW